jgi:hypothetical protein
MNEEIAYIQRYKVTNSTSDPATMRDVGANT